MIEVLALRNRSTLMVLSLLLGFLIFVLRDQFSMRLALSRLFGR